LLYQIVLGTAMENFEMIWDRTDPNYPKIMYKIPHNPIEYGIGADPLLDNLPFTEFWDGQNGYSALVMGQMTQVFSYIMEIRGEPNAGLVTNRKSKLRGDEYFGIYCEIIPKEELPHFDNEVQGIEIKSHEILGISDLKTKSIDQQKVKQDFTSKPSTEADQESAWMKFLNQFSIDKLDDLFKSPMSAWESAAQKIVEEKFNMNPKEVLDHFTNFEEDFIRIIGFFGPHILNEMGQLSQKMLENEKFARFYGHLFLSLKKNAERVVSQQVIEDLRLIIITLLERLAPELMITHLRLIPREKLLVLFFEGMQKAWQDLGVPFKSLKPTLAEEFPPSNEPKADTPPIQSGIDISAQKERERQNAIYQLIEELFTLTALWLSIPAQLAFLLFYSTQAGISDLYQKFFSAVKESGQRVTDLIEKIK
jgi:hypothetical protein